MFYLHKFRDFNMVYRKKINPNLLNISENSSPWICFCWGNFLRTHHHRMKITMNNKPPFLGWYVWNCFLKHRPVANPSFRGHVSKGFLFGKFFLGGSPILQPKILNDKAGNVAKVKLGFEKYHESARNCEVAFCFWESRFQRPVFFERTCYWQFDGPRDFD